jgi:GntP family gluconate:H+ symporter
MNSLFIFVITIGLVSLFIVKFKLQPFLSLTVSAFVYGLLSGMGIELISYITAGMGRIFSSFAIIIFSGAVIAEYLRKTNAIDRIVVDILELSGKKRGMSASAVSSYLVTLPVMCSITTYMILETVVKELGREEEGSGRRFQFMAAAASVISFNLIYPSPVIFSLTNDFSVRPTDALKIGLPISFLLLAIAYVYTLHMPKSVEKEVVARITPVIPRIHAWLPLLLPIALISLGLIIDSKSTRFMGNPNIALLFGALISLTMARDKTEGIISTASRRSGIIIFDLCGAGALGYVIARSDIGLALNNTFGYLPVLLAPFLISALIQFAQGSRVVTVVVASQMMSNYPLDGLTLMFLISGGAFMFSYVTDPYFWLIRDTTDSNLKGMLRDYTIPLSLCGIAVFAAIMLLKFSGIVIQ